MELKRFENSKRNLIFGVLNRGTLILFPFLNRTILLYILGEGYLGLDGLFSSIINVLSLTELGFGSAAVFCMYKPIVENDDDTICAILKLYRTVYRVIGTIILLGGLAAMPFLDKLIHGDIPDGLNVQLIFLIHLVNTVLSYFLFSYKVSILTAFQREDVISKLTMIATIMQYSLQFVILFVFRNYYLYLLVMPCLTIIKNMGQALAVKRMFPRYEGRGKLESSKIKQLLSKVKALFMHKIGGIIANSLDNIVISAFLGLSMVAIYGNYMYIYTSVMGLMNVFYTGIMAGIGNSLVSEPVEKNYRNFIQVSVINCWLSAWCAITMLCLYQPFMRLWAGERLLLEIGTVIIIVFYFYINLSRRIVVLYRDASGIWEKDQFVPLISGLVNVVCNVILIQKIGINGVIISTIIAFLFIEIPWQLRALYKMCFVGYNVKEYLRVQVFFFFLTIIVGGLTFGLVELIAVDGIACILVRAAVCIIFPNVLFACALGRKGKFIWDYAKRFISGGNKAE